MALEVDAVDTTAQGLVGHEQLDGFALQRERVEVGHLLPAHHGEPQAGGGGGGTVVGSDGEEQALAD